MGQPEDLMGAVTFLLSDASGYITGADLRGMFISQEFNVINLGANTKSSRWWLYLDIIRPKLSCLAERIILEAESPTLAFVDLSADRSSNSCMINQISNPKTTGCHSPAIWTYYFEVTTHNWRSVTVSLSLHLLFFLTSSCPAPVF